jgi:hypothetical protein
VDIEGYWAGIVGVEWREGNVELLKELPPALQAFKFDTEVSDMLKAIKGIVGCCVIWLLR